MSGTGTRSPVSTVVVVVGEQTDAVLAGLRGSPNVRAAALRDERPESASDFVAAAHTSYVLHDVDPLAHVAAAWEEFFGDRATLGTLDIELEQALGAFADGQAALPDYYLLLDPERLPDIRKHWWLGVLAARATHRVLPVAPTASAVRQQLRRLPTGRPWPDPARWLREVRTSVPDRVGLPSVGAGPATSSPAP